MAAASASAAAAAAELAASDHSHFACLACRCTLRSRPNAGLQQQVPPTCITSIRRSSLPVLPFCMPTPFVLHAPLHWPSTAPRFQTPKLLSAADPHTAAHVTLLWPAISASGRCGRAAGKGWQVGAYISVSVAAHCCTSSAPPGYVHTRPQVLAVPHTPRRKHSSCTRRSSQRCFSKACGCTPSRLASIPACSHRILRGAPWLAPCAGAPPLACTICEWSTKRFTSAPNVLTYLQGGGRQGMHWNYKQGSLLSETSRCPRL